MKIKRVNAAQTEFFFVGEWWFERVKRVLRIDRRDGKRTAGLEAWLEYFTPLSSRGN